MSFLIEGISNLRIHITGFALLMIVAAGCASPDLVTRSIISDLRERIAEKGSGEARKAEEWVDLQVLYRNMPVARAYQPVSGPVIVITSGYLDMSRFLAEASIVSRSDPGKFHQCLSRYTRTLSKSRYQSYKRLGKDAGDLNSGRNPYWLVQPKRFFNEQTDQCKELTARWPLSDAEKQIREQAVADQVKFVYLHELAHVASGPRPKHLWKKSLRLMSKPKRLEALIQSRQREYDADDWAAEQFMKLHDDPFRLFQTDLYLSNHQITGNRNCNSERRSTHPSADRRTARVMQKMMEIADETNRQIAPDLRRSMSRFIVRVNIRVKKNDCAAV